MLKNLPRPSARHIEALDNMVDEIFMQHGLSDEEMEYRGRVVQEIEDVITAAIPGTFA